MSRARTNWRGHWGETPRLVAARARLFSSIGAFGNAAYSWPPDISAVSRGEMRNTAEGHLSLIFAAEESHLAVALRPCLASPRRSTAVDCITRHSITALESCSHRPLGRLPCVCPKASCACSSASPRELIAAAARKKKRNKLCVQACSGP